MPPDKSLFVNAKQRFPLHVHAAPVHAAPVHAAPVHAVPVHAAPVYRGLKWLIGLPYQTARPPVITKGCFLSVPFGPECQEGRS